MTPLIILRVAHMDRYDRANTITSGGSHFIANGVGGAGFNLNPSRGKGYGYAMSVRGIGLNLELVGVEVVHEGNHV
jgi:hypothetical protein